MLPIAGRVPTTPDLLAEQTPEGKRRPLLPGSTGHVVASCCISSMKNDSSVTICSRSSLLTPPSLWEKEPLDQQHQLKASELRLYIINIRKNIHRRALVQYIREWELRGPGWFLDKEARRIISVSAKQNCVCVARTLIDEIGTTRKHAAALVRGGRGRRRRASFVHLSISSCNNLEWKEKEKRHTAHCWKHSFFYYCPRFSLSLSVAGRTVSQIGLMTKRHRRQYQEKLTSKFINCLLLFCCLHLNNRLGFVYYLNNCNARAPHVHFSNWKKKKNCFFLFLSKNSIIRRFKS